MALLPAAVCSAPEARVVEGPAATAVRKGMASGTAAFPHEAWDGLLRRHADAAAGVDYAGMRAERAVLDGYLGRIAAAPLASLGRRELLALLINAYNACTVRLILDAAGGGALPASIRDLPDPWGRKLCNVGGETLSLDAIEHGLLRPLFRDSRIHAAVNCASKGCPPLRPRAFAGPEVERQLQEAMAALVDSPAHVRVERGALWLSRIFDWYRPDFTEAGFEGAAPSLSAYVARFARPERRREIEALGPTPKLQFLEYDWSLNDRTRKAAATPSR